MPTDAKIERVADIKDKLERCSIALTTGYSGIPVNDMTDLRRRMRDAGVEFVVVKNTLANLAAEEANVPQFSEIIEGPTAIAFGYDDPVDTARAVNDYIRATRSPLAILGAIMGPGPVLQRTEVERLATLPSKPQLIANLLGQMQAPLSRLLGVLNGPLQNLDGLLQARIRQLEESA
ncbi:50S ribosomal protein L10 [Geodia barretti]|uniref:Large ribosomal subunit protein uL10m n=1 Tax=Geodia barretti TaxID=519541 RepID=A0AA35SNF2_GEOBA|nr:50S ribosomal protein L10 [Geodia barretti]